MFFSQNPLIDHLGVYSDTNNNNYNDKTTPFRKSHTVILKKHSRVNIKTQNLTIMAITVMKSSQKTYKMKDLVALS